ncbi:MAG: hypothetical protein ACE367_19120, partial [Acidimicrobiales bacterium]
MAPLRRNPRPRLGRALVHRLLAMLVIVASLAVMTPASASAPEPTPRARTVALSLSATVPISGTPSPYALQVSATKR